MIPGVEFPPFVLLSMGTYWSVGALTATYDGLPIYTEVSAHFELVGAAAMLLRSLNQPRVG